MAQKHRSFPTKKRTAKVTARLEQSPRFEFKDTGIISVPAVKTRLRQRTELEAIISNSTIAAAVMVFAAILAVIIANSAFYSVIHEFIETPLGILVGRIDFSMSLETFVNDFLMAIFFLLVGIELKYEMTVGELTKLRQAALPMLAAVGGVLVPATIYLVLNDGATMHGWAVPIATDIAFALGVMSLLGKRIAPSTKVFFSTLAIADDILAIIVIAAAYGHSPSVAWIAATVGVIFALFCLNRAHVYSAIPYMLVGLILWFCMFKSGVHATLAGVILAFFLPARSDVNLSHVSSWLQNESQILDDYFEGEEHVLGQHHFTDQAHRIERIMRRVTPPLQRIEHLIAVPVNFLILPIFAFVNAQVRLVGVDLGGIMADPVTLGALMGAVVGKPLGIIGVSFLLVKIKFAKLPKGMDWHQVIAVGILGGLGFTMSILIAGLAFTNPNEILAAKCAILIGSVTSSILGILYVNLMCKRRNSSTQTNEGVELDTTRVDIEMVDVKVTQ